MPLVTLQHTLSMRRGSPAHFSIVDASDCVKERLHGENTGVHVQRPRWSGASLALPPRQAGRGSDLPFNAWKQGEGFLWGL